MTRLNAAVPDQWPHPRGPQFDGHADAGAIQLPFKGGTAPILWMMPIEGGYSGFAVAGSNVYTQIQTEAGQFVICLDLDTGRELWRHRYGAPWNRDGVYPGPYASPAISGDRVYFTGCTGQIGSLDRHSGKVIWAHDLVKVFNVELTPFGYACTPLILDNTAYFTGGGLGKAVIALDATDGTLRWQAGDEPVTYASPFPVKIGDRIQIIAFLENLTVSLDPHTGKELWRDPWPEGYDPHTSWPLYSEPFLVRTSPFRRGVRVLRLTDTESSKAELVWTSDALSNDFFSSVIIDRYLYGFDLTSVQADFNGRSTGAFTCVNLLNGDVRWRTDAVGYSSVIACGDKLIIFSETGQLIIASASPERYHELVRVPLLSGELCWAPPALVNGRLLVRGDSHIACVLVHRDHPQSNSRWSSHLRAWRALWLATFRGDKFAAPTMAALSIWFAACLAVLLIGVAVAGALVRVRAGPRLLISSFLAILVGVAGMPLCSVAAGRLIFTWPAALFIAFGCTVVVGHSAISSGHRKKRVQARLVLLAFVLFCAGYWLLCNYAGLPAGRGFLVGLFPAAIVSWPLMKSWKRRTLGSGIAAGALVFVCYYWISVIFVLWRMG